MRKTSKNKSQGKRANKKGMPNRKKAKRKNINNQLAQELIKVLNAEPEKPLSFRQLCRILQLKKKAQKNALELILDKLVENGEIDSVGRKYQSKESGGKVIGVVDHVNPKFGYIVISEEEQDIWISTSNLNRAFDGDTVEVKTHYNPTRRRTEGEVVKIVKRAKEEFIGHLEISARFAFVVTMGRKMHQDIFIPKHHMQDAKHGDKVIAKITEWREKDKNPTGKIEKVLGKAGENETEIHSIMFEYDLPFKFPEEVEQEAEAIPEEIPAEEIKKRKDFRKRTTFTIDPLTAKDFDDAISIRKMNNGQWEIGVHIADVTHYVRPNTQLEEEAQKRATSVYLVDRTVPMLPEKLSNGLCSLNPHVDRLAFSAVFNMDETGKIHKQWFGRTVIHSDRRFTYEEAQERIETGEGDYATEINLLNDIAKELRQQRFQNGAISFESVELRFELDEDGKPIKLVPRIRKDAHKLVEDFMLLANKRVAEYVFRKKENGKPVTMVYRTHDLPDPEKLSNFALFAKRFGYTVNVEENSVAASMNQLTEEVEGKPEQNIIEQQAIRTMAKAKYTTEADGHYGLAFKHYTHFTSPIRRYPDMMVHRLLQHYLDKKKSVDRILYEDKCQHSSEMEKKAATAERASIKYKQVEFMQEYVGRAMEGVISGVTEWGIFVELEETRCEGLVRLSSMGDDYYSYDEEKMAVVGERYKQEYRIGDRVKVLVKDTNIEKRTIDFEML
ncbi:ribonuclease R [Algivirga pacifica]|uniref:Ribonuclease R n=1 Tax=Algivirga pacifica TaxID=1162670 RepID=A0ABP9D8Z2_9BACT